MGVLKFKDLTYHCNITDEFGRAYVVDGWDSIRNSVSVHRGRMGKKVAAIENFVGIELTNEVLNACDVEMVSENIINIGELTITSLEPFVYLHQIQRSYLAETNEVLIYKPI